MDDVKNSASDLKKGKIFWVITVQLAEPFNYGSHLITDFALLVYSGEVEPSEAATIKLDWGRGKIEKVTTLEKDVDCGLAKVNIIVKVDGPADIKPYSLSYLWPLTPDRPEGDMIFGVECEILTLMQNCGLLKAKGRILNRKEITIFFLRDAVLINSKGLSRHSTFADQMQPVQKQVWRCTCQRLMPQERKSVKKRTSEEAQYKAQLVWCEMCIPSVQGVQVAGNNGVTKATDSTTTTPETPAQSGGGNAWPVGGPVAAAEKEVWGAVKGLGTLDTPLTPASRPKKTHNSKQGTGVGHLTEAYQTVARVTLDDQQLKFVARENCFLYGVCLGKVELWHVLSIGLSINYELTADKKELKMVWVGSVKPLEPALLLSTLRDWCLVHNVTSSASTILQMEAGWLPLDLTPTAGPEEDTDVVEVTAPRVAL
ncbi:hypothetical protein GWK47_016655 [Chionoecetes opilio]|uniref:Uncharacterized protein n=1 Tax=Chionoecetes opilio TaxID=41210 RepID=A0A8J5CK56_CHIOP|nr:hypothetical protein GWK47_016655 [Chionoecetes opilio]